MLVYTFINIFVYILIKIYKMNSIKLFSNSEALTLNALDKLNAGKLNPQTFKLINAVVWNVVNQLEQTEQLKKHNIKIND